MSCDGKIYVGQIGVLIEVETQQPDCPAVDWSDATTLEIRCKLPDGLIVNFPAALNGTKLQYVTLTATDLPLKGKYLVQAHVVGPLYDALGETTNFTIYEAWK